MTTVVKVAAHCSNKKQVVVQIHENDELAEEVIMQDGESKEFYAYDSRVISVKEELIEQ